MSSSPWVSSRSSPPTPFLPPSVELPTLARSFTRTFRGRRRCRRPRVAWGGGSRRRRHHDHRDPLPRARPRARARTSSRRADGLLLPDARLRVRGGRRGAGDDGSGMAKPRPVRGSVVAAHLAVSDRHQRLPRPARRPEATGPADGPRAGAPGRRAAARTGGGRVVGRADARRRVSCPGGDPADAVASSDTIRLAFIAALQHLPPRQRAVLDAARGAAPGTRTRWPSCSTPRVASVNSALQRARATLAERAA